MNRRHFLRLLLATPSALELDVEKLLWIPNQQIWVPHPAQIAFYEGIPYHQSNATTGVWLGIHRAQEVRNELESLILTCIEHKKNEI